MSDIQNLSKFVPVEAVACEPFETKKVTSQAIGTGSSIQYINNKVKHVLLKVLCGGVSQPYQVVAAQATPGSYIAVDSNQYTTEWAKNEYQLTNGTKYIMVPYSSIRGIYHEGPK